MYPVFLGLASSHYYNGIAFFYASQGSNGHVFRAWSQTQDLGPLGLTFASPEVAVVHFKGSLGWFGDGSKHYLTLIKISNEGAIFLSFVWIIYITLGANVPAVTNLMSNISWGFLLFHHFRKRGRLQERTGTPLRRREWRKPRSGWKAGEVRNWGNVEDLRLHAKNVETHRIEMFWWRGLLWWCFVVKLIFR